MKNEVEFEYVTDEGTNAERFLQRDQMIIRFANNCYTLFKDGDLQWESTNDNFIDETVEKIISLCAKE